MKEYLCGKAALKYWKIPDIIGNIEPKDTVFTKKYIIFTDKKLYRSQGSHRHTCSFLKAEKYTKNGVCTIPLVFLQLASEYSIYQLIYLGLQICSGYKGKAPRWSVKQLKKCAMELKGHKGRRAALRALKYIKEGSRSPQESYLFMRLSLPFSLGGCGFKGIVFNHKIYLKEKGKYLYVDLYIAKFKLAIEYDSFLHHNNSKSYSGDNARDAKLTSLGYRVIHVVPGQLSDLEAFKILAGNIAKAIKKRLRVRARKFFDGFTQLVSLFLNKKKEYTRRDTSSIHQVPSFPGVKKMYEIYVMAWRREFGWST